MFNHTTFLKISAAFVATAIAGAAQAAILVNTGLTGATSYDGWDQLTRDDNPGYPGFGSSDPWPQPIPSNEGEDAELNRLAGSSYPAGSSLYSPSGGTLQVSDATPLAGLETIVFSIASSMTSLSPTLSVNGAPLADLPTEFNLGSQSVVIGGFPTTTNILTYQWNLTGVVDPISDFAVDFTAGSHSTVVGLQLDQGDTFGLISPTATPEPSALALVGLGGLLAARRRRR